jgi:hypothetical protein
MARDARDLHRLAQELAALTPEERARVLAEAVQGEVLRPPPSNFSPPVLSGGGIWVGGDLRRETLYGDDGR